MLFQCNVYKRCSNDVACNTLLMLALGLLVFADFFSDLRVIDSLYSVDAEEKEEKEEESIKEKQDERVQDEEEVVDEDQEMLEEAALDWAMGNKCDIPMQPEDQ